MIAEGQAAGDIRCKPVTDCNPQEWWVCKQPAPVEEEVGPSRGANSLKSLAGGHLATYPWGKSELTASLNLARNGDSAAASVVGTDERKEGRLPNRITPI